VDEQQLVPDIYTNAIQLQTSVFEFALVFALMSPGEGEPRPLVRVRMSPQQALALHLILENNIEVYEKEFAEIVLPDSVLKRLKLADINEGESDDDTN